MLRPSLSRAKASKHVNVIKNKKLSLGYAPSAEFLAQQKLCLQKHSHISQCSSLNPL